MTTATTTPTNGQFARDPRGNWFYRAESWLDERGRPAWLIAMVLGFIVFWPVGLALLAYMIWSNRMFSKSNKSCRSQRSASFSGPFSPSRSSGNSAFDAYREDTLRRLEEEQQNFEAFLSRLRDAKDKAEFDQFMDDRANRPANRPARTTDGDALEEPRA